MGGSSFNLLLVGSSNLATDETELWLPRPWPLVNDVDVFVAVDDPEVDPPLFCQNGILQTMSKKLSKCSRVRCSARMDG